MNNVPEAPGDAAPNGQNRLRELNGKVAAMRAVLVQLLQDVVQAESRLDRSQAAQLLEANENLTVGALRAQSDAETANGALDEASRIGTLDPLTGLPNRTLLLDRFDSAIANAKRHGNRVALLFVDLDSFKQINDRLGHAAGDEALQLVADCLTSLVRQTDTVSRHGGDEFLILLAEVVHASDAAHVASKVNAVLGSHAHASKYAVGLSASIGISVYPEDGEDAKALIDRADAAMYRAKKQGLGGFVFHGYGPAEQIFLAAPPEPTARDNGHHQVQLREANEALVLAALGAQELLAAAEEVKARQTELLELVANELSDPFAPIRLAAATLGFTGAESTLLARVQQVVEAQADRMARMVRDVLEKQDAEAKNHPAS